MMRIHLLLALLTTLLPYGECMPNTLTGTATYHTTTDVPAAGDARSAASVDGAFQDLLDNDTYLNTRLLGDGIVLWRGSLASIPSTNHIAIGAIDQVIIGGKSFHGVVTTFDAASLSNNTRYYIYCYDNSGTLAYEKSTTAPDGDLYFKTGDTTRVYLGTFLSTGSGTIVPFSAKRGRYRYRRSDTTGDIFLLAFAPTSGVWTDLVLSQFMPPGSRVAFLSTDFHAATSGDSLRMRTNGDTGDTYILGSELSVTSDTNTIEIQTDVNRKIQFWTLRGDGSVFIWIDGFEE